MGSSSGQDVSAAAEHHGRRCGISAATRAGSGCIFHLDDGPPDHGECGECMERARRYRLSGYGYLRMSKRKAGHNSPAVRSLRRTTQEGGGPASRRHWRRLTALTVWEITGANSSSQSWRLLCLYKVNTCDIQGRHTLSPVPRPTRYLSVTGVP